MEAMSKSASGWAMLSRMEHNSNNVRELSLFPDDDTESEERQEVDKIDLQPLFDRLAKSKFRSFFYLNAKDKAYIKEKGWDKIEQGIRETIAKRWRKRSIPTHSGWLYPLTFDAGKGLKEA